MRKNQLGKRGFTLVELMIVVAIIGVLAALAIYGVRRYLASSKTSEAKNTIGAISRGATAAFERETVAAEGLEEGEESGNVSHSLCETANAVPTLIPGGTKYQPKTGNNLDFESGDEVTGWKCLKFSLTQPHYYQYSYTKDGQQVANPTDSACATDCYEAAAQGDLDNDGTPSGFARTGQINTTTGQLRASTQIFILDEFE